MFNRLFLFFLLLIPYLAFSQQTEDLIDNNYDWVNAGIVNTEITCWAPWDPGYCGPLPAIGAFSPDGINFSYGLTNLYQPIDIQMALNAAGTGIIITGFNFYFTAKNGNGWDDGRTDEDQIGASYDELEWTMNAVELIIYENHGRFLSRNT